jgi:hypothetical protein
VALPSGTAAIYVHTHTIINQACQVAVPLDSGTQNIWIVNVSLDEASEESRLVCIRSLLYVLYLFCM